jgi:hypothetical protein
VDWWGLVEHTDCTSMVRFQCLNVELGATGSGSDSSHFEKRMGLEEGAATKTYHVSTDGSADGHEPAAVSGN